MNDYELVSGLIDAAVYVVPVLVGAVLWFVGWKRRPKGGSSFLMGLGIVLLVIFGVASIQPVSNALDRANAPSTSSLQAASPSTTLAPPTTTTGACRGFECLDEEVTDDGDGFVREPPADPITPAQEVWCQASPENQIYVMLAADILGLHEFDRGALTRALEGTLTDADQNLIIEQAEDWPFGRMWERQSSDFIDPPQPSAWALACAAAHESVFGS